MYLNDEQIMSINGNVPDNNPFIRSFNYISKNQKVLQYPFDQQLFSFRSKAEVKG